MEPFKTPSIPTWIKTLSTSGYTNIYQCNLGNDNLFGTETLLGDWDGPVLAVAKDFAPAEEVKRLIDAPGTDLSRVYRHNDGDGRYHTGYKTNKRLIRFMYGPENADMINGSKRMDCGALFISACFFLKAGDDSSSGLNGWVPGSDVFEKSRSVFRFVVDRMPNLRAIAGLGKDAQRLVHDV